MRKLSLMIIPVTWLSNTQIEEKSFRVLRHAARSIHLGVFLKVLILFPYKSSSNAQSICL